MHPYEGARDIKGIAAMGNGEEMQPARCVPRVISQDEKYRPGKGCVTEAEKRHSIFRDLISRPNAHSERKTIGGGKADR